MVKGCFGIVYKAKFRSAGVKGNLVCEGTVLVRYSSLWLFQVSSGGNYFFLCLEVLFGGRQGLGRRQGGVGGSVRSGVCVGEMVVGKSAIVCVGS
jgi:hypothetical protein